MKVTKKPHLLILAILALSMLFRFIYLGTESLWLDEAFSACLARMDLGTMLELGIRHEVVEMPLYYLLLHFWMMIFGEGEGSIRLLSACCGIAAVPVLYSVGRELFNHRIGLIASFLLAISSFAVAYSQEARQYSLLLLLTLLSFLLFIKILKAERVGKIHFICYTLVNILLCYTHPYGLFSIGTQVLYFLIYWRRCKKVWLVFWGAQAITLVSFLPFLGTKVVSIKSGLGQISWIPEPSLSLANSIFKGLAGAGFIGSAWGTFLMWFLIVLCLAGILFLPGAVRRGDSRKKVKGTVNSTRIWPFAEPATNLVLLWLLIPFVMAFILSFAIQPMLVDRYLIGIVPALYLLAAKGIINIASLVGPGSVRAKATTGVLIIMVAAVTASGLYSYYVDYHKLDWRGATAYIEQYAQPGDAIVFYPDYERWSFDYYHKGEPEITVISHKAVLMGSGAGAGNERLWLVQLPLSTEKDISVQRELFYRFGDEALIGRAIVEPFIIYLFAI